MKAKVISKNHVVYRSKLEATYGGLFEAAGIDFTFEPKLFQTPDGYYLPDFYLHRYDVYVEIKPTAPTDQEWAKLKSVSEQVGRPALFLCGRPRLEVFSSNYSGELMDYIVEVFFGIVLPNSASKFYVNINEIIDRCGVDVENLFHFAFTMRLDEVLEDLNRHHISDYIMSAITEVAPEQRYKFHKENPPIRTFEHCLLDREYCRAGVESLKEIFFELEKLDKENAK